MIIRKAEKGDIEGILRLLIQVLAVHHEGRPDLFKETGFKYTAEQIEEIIADPAKPVFVAIDENGRVLAHAFCVINDNKETPAVYPYKNLYIDDFCVDKEARGRHVGTRLYEYVKKYASDEGFYNITLHAWDGNAPAISFYESLGMKVQQFTMEEVLSSD